MGNEKENKKKKSYRDLQVYQKSCELALRVHNISLKLPNFELFEQGSQLRRASKSIPANIVEGYGRRRYKADFIRFLTYANASCYETQHHLEMILKSGKDMVELQGIIEEYNDLGKRIYRFIDYVENKWNE